MDVSNSAKNQFSQIFQRASNKPAFNSVKENYSAINKFAAEDLRLKKLRNQKSDSELIQVPMFQFSGNSKVAE